MSDIWNDIQTGTIADADIVRLALANNLIVEAFEKDCVKQACYELRASDIFYDVQSAEEDKRVVIGAGNGYLLKPHCYVVSIIRAASSATFQRARSYSGEGAAILHRYSPNQYLRRSRV